MILHGAGSAKESHFDFARGCRADGIAALAYDARGHGRSRGRRSGRARSTTRWRWSSCCAGTPSAVALRGSSMGGFQAIHAGARDPVAVRGRGDLPGARGPAAAQPALGRAAALPLRRRRPPRSGWSRSTSTRRCAELGPRTGLLLLHARGDEQIPWTVSEELHAAAHEPKRLLVLPGGHHRSLQHDLELQAESRRFILAAAEGSWRETLALSR